MIRAKAATTNFLPFLGIVLTAYLSGWLLLKYEYKVFVLMLGLPLLAFFFHQPIFLLGGLYVVSYCLPLTTLFGQSAVTLNRMLGVLLLGILLVQMASKKERWIPIPRWILLTGSFLFGMVGYFFTGISGESFESLKDLLSAAFLMFFAIQLVRKEKEVHALLWLISFCSAGAGLFALFEFFTQGAFFSSRLIRVGGFFHSNIFAINMAVGIPIFFFLFRRASLRGRVFLTASLILSLTSILISASRGGLVTAAVGVALLAWKRVISLRFLLLPVLLFFFTLPYFPLGNRERLLTLPLVKYFFAPRHPALAEESILNRLGHFHVGGRMLLMNPMGVGIGNYRTAYMEYRLPGMYSFPRSSHNAYITLFCEYGIFGGILFALFLLNICRKGKAAREGLGGGSLNTEMVFFLRTVLLVFALAAFFSNTILYDRTLWFLMGVQYALYLLQKRSTSPKDQGKVEGYLPVKMEV